MFITDSIRLASALHWLSSDVNLGPMQLLAVVLDPSFRSLERLKSERARIHAMSEYALVLVMGEHWSDAGDVGSASASDATVRDWVPGFYGSLRTPVFESMRRLQDEPDVSPLDLILELLDLSESALPGVFLRARGKPPVWVSLPDDDSLLYLLEVLSRGARGHERGASSITGILDAAGLAGVSFSPETVGAWDSVLLGRGRGGRAARAHADWRQPEFARVASVWRRASGASVTWGRANAHRALLARLGPFLRDDHHRRLKTAAYADANEDWGTVAVNISCVIEGSVARALFAAARVHLGVRAPAFVQWWDPELGPVPDRGERDFNAPKGPRVGASTAATQVPWRPPNLTVGLATLATMPDIDARSTPHSRELMDSIARAALGLRNPPAHGDPVDRDTARAAWELLDAWTSTGCASALHELARSLNAHGTVDEDAKLALRTLDSANFSALDARWIALWPVRAKRHALSMLHEQVTNLRAQIASLLLNGLTGAGFAALKNDFAQVGMAIDRRLFPTFPIWPARANRLDAVLAAREKLALRFFRAYPDSALLDAVWLTSVSDADADRDGLSRALAFVRERIAVGAADVPGHRSNRKLESDIEHQLQDRQYPAVKHAASGVWLTQLDVELARIESDVREIRVGLDLDPPWWTPG